MTENATCFGAGRGVGPPRHPSTLRGAPCQKCQNVADLPAGYSNADYFVQIVGVLHPGGQFLEEQGHTTLRAGGAIVKASGMLLQASC
jgi:hypothetical protein